MRHELSLHIPHVMNSGVLPIYDISVYESSMPISCPTLQILLPGFTKAVTINEDSPMPLIPDFIRKVNACEMGIQKANCGQEFYDLPDGIYVIKYSVSPNEIVYVEYNHLRITCAKKKLQEHLCSLQLDPYAPDEHRNAKFNRLMEVSQWLDAAVASVEYCKNPKKGMDMYNHAVKILEKMDCSTSFC